MEKITVIDLEKYQEDTLKKLSKDTFKKKIGFLINEDRESCDIKNDLLVGCDTWRINQALEYLKTLHNNDSNKDIIFLAQKINGKFSQKAFRYNAIYSALMHGTSCGDVGISAYGIDFNKDTYMSLNSFYREKRGSDYANINCIQLEYDNHEVGFKMTDEIFNSVIALLDMDYFDIKVPYPTMIVRTGRGIQFIWKLDNCKNKRLQQKVARSMFKELQEFKLYGLEMDATALDLARIFRVPGTMHTITKNITEIYSNTGEIFELEDIMYGYYPELVDEEQNIKTEKRKYTFNKERKVKYTTSHWNYNILNKRRCEDLELLFSLRNGCFKKCRNYFMHLYCYHLALAGNSKEYILSKAIKLDNGFSLECYGSLGENDIKHIINSVYEKANKLLSATNKKDYELQDVYRYTNKRIIELFGITIEEQKQMSTIRSKDIKIRILQKL